MVRSWAIAGHLGGTGVGSTTNNSNDTTMAEVPPVTNQAQAPNLQTPGKMATVYSHAIRK